MNILVIGGDGFCGWPTALLLAGEGNSVVIVDNLSRRLIDKKLGTSSLTAIETPEERCKEARRLGYDLSFVNIDLAVAPGEIRKLISEFRPKAIVHFGEQRAAPYSMIDDERRRYTVDNNIRGTHNLLSAIVDLDRDIHLIHLGTMGVYGYSDDFGPVPEGYLDVIPKATGKDVEILYPSDPGSVYHMTKVLDQSIFYYYNKNWRLKITDLHQGIVWGVQTPDTRKSPKLINRFDYDGCYGTVLNRFIVQGINSVPLTIYGTGGQTRAFINIADTAKCVALALETPPEDGSRVRIFNQVAETKSISQLANIVCSRVGADVEFIENPRNERAENELTVKNDGLKNLGFAPLLLSEEGFLSDLEEIAAASKARFDPDKYKNSPKW